MKTYVTRLARVCSRLNAERARYLIMGATAMQLWGTTRATRDIDILIEPSVANARRVLRALAGLGLGLARELSPEEVATRPVTVIGDMPNVDILTRAWNVTFRQAHPRSTTFHIEGVAVPAGSIEDLIESKRTGRLQDAADIEVLEEIARRLRSSESR
jgi:predicted nucleotidyltransferase